MGQLISDVEEILDNKKARTAADNERKKMLEEMRRINAEKENLVRKSLAAQRAKFGAGTGGGSAGMSSEAVFKRLKSETAEPFDAQLRGAMDKLNKIQTPRANLLKKWAKRMLAAI